MRPTDSTAPNALGIDLGGTKIEAIVLDAHGRTLARERVATPAGDYRATLAAVKSLVDGLEARLGWRAVRIGVGTPGTQAADGLIKNANSVCLNGMPLAHDLSALLARPVRLANDANCLALSEATDGAGAGADVVFAAILGTGTGAGVVVHGQVLGGVNGLAGEWGHNPLPWTASDEWPGHVCYCGRQGCIETWLSGPGLARDHRQHGGQASSALEIAARAADGDAPSEASLARYVSRLARALAQVVNLLDPQVIVLGGGLSNIERLYTDVPRLWGEFVFGAGVREPVRTRLVKSRHGDSSGVRGAAWLWSGFQPGSPAGLQRPDPAGG